ncbi:MAG: hypothetical protein ACI4QJ_00005, partial [Candidatus Spyradenecus sp.]
RTGGGLLDTAIELLKENGPATAGELIPQPPPPPNNVTTLACGDWETARGEARRAGGGGETGGYPKKGGAYLEVT